MPRVSPRAPLPGLALEANRAVPYNSGTGPRHDSRDRSLPHRSIPWLRETQASVRPPVSPPLLPWRNFGDCASRKVEAFILIFSFVSLLLLDPSTAACVDHRTRPGVPYSETAVFADVKPIQPFYAASPCRPTMEVVSWRRANSLRPPTPIGASGAQHLMRTGAIFRRSRSVGGKREREGKNRRFFPRRVQGESPPPNENLFCFERTRVPQMTLFILCQLIPRPKAAQALAVIRYQKSPTHSGAEPV